jgi:molecular chaperone GrpE
MRDQNSLSGRDMQLGQGYLLQLSSQADTLQEQLTHLLAEVQRGGIQLDLLTRRMTDPSTNQGIEAQLAEVVTRLETTEEELETLAKTIKKQSRTQFKANTLSESQQKRVTDALATLQELVTRRDEAESARALQQKQQIQNARQQARGEMAGSLLPALDGLENAIQSGRLLFKRRQEEKELPPVPQTTLESQPDSATPNFWERLSYVFGGDIPQQAPIIYRIGTLPEQKDEPLAAWLGGLELVRERFLSILAAEGIQLIPALDQPFDPKLHVALEAVERDDVPPGTIVAVVRPGYREDKRILRYAEVAVSKAVVRVEVSDDKVEEEEMTPSEYTI